MLRAFDRVWTRTWLRAALFGGVFLTTWLLSSGTAHAG
jgi:hypothetical protein